MYSYRRPILLILSVLILGYLNSSFAQSKASEYLLEILESSYRKGEYKVGLDRLRDFEPKVINQDGAQSLSMGHVYACKALIYASLSKFELYQVDLKNAEGILKDKPNTEQGYYAATLTLAKCYHIFGDYHKALQVLNKNIATLPPSSLNHYVYSYWINKINYQLGYVQNVEKKLVQDLTNLEAIQDTSLTKKQLKAQLTLLHIDILISEGNTEEGEKLIEANKAWVQEYFQNTYGYKAHFTYREGLIQANLHQYATANKLFKQSYQAGLRFYALHAPFFVQLQRTRATNLIKLGKPTEASFWQNDLDVKVKNYYGKKSVAFYDHKLTEVNALYDLKDYKKAYNGLKKYKEDNDFYPDDHIGKIAIWKLMYNVYLKSSKIALADTTLQKITKLSLKKYGQESPIYHYTYLENIKFQYSYTNSIHNLTPSFKQSLFETIKPNLSTKNATYYPVVFDLVDLYLLNEQLDSAKLTIDKLVSELQIEGSKIGLMQALNLASYTEIQLGNFKTAQKHLDDAFKIQKDHSYLIDEDILIKSYYTLALLQRETGNFEGAKTSYLNIEKITSDNHFFTSKLDINDIAWLNIGKGKYSKTKKELKADLNLKSTIVGEEHWSLIEPLLYLAEIAIIEGEFNSAEEYLIRAKKITEPVFGKESLRMSRVLMLYKKLYTAIGNYEKAEASILQSLDILHKIYGEDHVKVCIPSSELALAIVLNTTDFKNVKNKSIQQECEKLLSSAQTILKEEYGDQNPLYAEVLENLGTYQFFTHNFKEASKSILKARKIWEKELGTQNIHTAELDFTLGDIFYFSKSYAKALEHYNRSKNSYKNIFGSNHPEYTTALGMEARMNYIQGNTKEAIEASEEVVDKSLGYIHNIFPNLSERGKARYWEKVKEHFEFYNTLAFTQYNTYPDMIGKVFDINLQTKAILLNSSVKIKNNILNSGDSTLIQSFEKWTDKKEVLISNLSIDQEQRKKEGINLTDLENEIERLEKYLGQKAEGFNTLKSTEQTYKWQDLTDVLKEDEEVIEIIAFRVFTEHFTDSVWYTTLALNSNTKNNPNFHLNKNGNFLHKRAIKYYQNSIKFNLADSKSYTNFWLPIASTIEQDKKIYISFDGVYNKINLESIRTPENDFILNHYQIIVMGTSRDLLERKRKEKKQDEQNKTACFVGNPTFYPTLYDQPKYWTNLKGTEVEVNKLSEYLNSQDWNTTTYKTTEATEKVIKEVKNPTIFHIATHGFYVEKETENELNKITHKTASNPLLRSGILLKDGGEIFDNSEIYEFNKQDGILTAYEAMNLNLEKTDLVVLSACETGLGEIELGEGVFGLQRSFVVAGAKSIIVSLFKVSDEVTTELMNNFYKHWDKDHTASEALILAKNEIMTKYNNPKLWGAFVMIGE